MPRDRHPLKWLRNLKRPTIVAVCISLCLSCNLYAYDETDQERPEHSSSDWVAHFEQKIRPVLIERCVGCHGSTKMEGGLRLHSIQGLQAGGESGKVIDGDDWNASLILEAIRYKSYEMPPDGQLDSKTIKNFELWVKNGAHWPESETLREAKDITAEDRSWWAFQPLASPQVPRLKNDNWSHNDLDRFVLAKLRKRGMEPAPQADPESRLRRLYFSTIGLPPSSEDIQQWLEDTSQEAWQRIVSKLLEDPRYGEHWARYWLDLVRYSESDGWNQDAYRPHIWRYRDYVVNSFNSNKPYPQFVLEQLAGDELGSDNPDHLVATGFLRLGIYEYNQRDARGHWNDIMNEMTDVAGDVFLGLSMACARCHDHKFDPIPQRDYFRLRAFFEPVIWKDDQFAATPEEIQRHKEESKPWLEATKDIREEMERLVEPYHAKKWLSTVDKFPLEIQACFHMPIPERTSWQHQMAYLVYRQFEEEGGGPLKSMSKEHKKQYEKLKESLTKFEHLKPKPLPKFDDGCQL